MRVLLFTVFVIRDDLRTIFNEITKAKLESEIRTEQIENDLARNPDLSRRLDLIASGRAEYLRPESDSQLKSTFEEAENTASQSLPCLHVRNY